jgi:hypothetical protein
MLILEKIGASDSMSGSFSNQPQAAWQSDSQWMWQLQIQTQDVRAVAGQIYVWFHLNFPNQPILALLVGEKKQISVLLDCLRASFSRVNMWWDGQLIAYECQKGCKKLFLRHTHGVDLTALFIHQREGLKGLIHFLGRDFIGAAPDFIFWYIFFDMSCLHMHDRSSVSQ